MTERKNPSQVLVGYKPVDPNTPYSYLFESADVPGQRLRAGSLGKIGPNRPRPVLRTATLFGSRLWLQLREWDPAQGRGVSNLDAEGT